MIYKTLHTKLKIKQQNTTKTGGGLMCSYVTTKAYERWVSRYIGPGPGQPRRGSWISEGPHSLRYRRFVLIFQLKSSILREVSVCPEALKQSCSALQNLSWRPWSPHIEGLQCQESERSCINMCVWCIAFASVSAIFRFDFRTVLWRCDYFFLNRTVIF